MSTVPNITWINGTVATGGSLSPYGNDASAQARAIIKQGVTHVVDMRSEWCDEDIWERFDVKHLWLPTTDASGHHIPASLFDNLVAFAKPAIRGTAKILVHCHMGINRGPSGAMAVLLEQGLDPVTALSAVKGARTVAYVAYSPDAYLAHLQRHRGLEDKSVSRDHKNFLKKFKEINDVKESNRVEQVIRKLRTAEWNGDN